MVHLVDSLVQRPVVQASMEPVVPSILHNKKDGNLNGHLQEGGEWHTVVHAEVGGNGMEEPNLRKLGGEVADENDGGTVPLLLEGGNLLVLNLVLVEIGNLVHNKERNAPAEIDDFVHDEAHDAGRKGIILHKEIPSRPQTLGKVEVDIVLGDLLEHGKVVLGRVGGVDGCVEQIHDTASEPEFDLQSKKKTKVSTRCQTCS